MRQAIRWCHGVVSGLALASTLGCSGSDSGKPGGEGDEHAAVVGQMYSTLVEGDIAKAAELTTKLDAAAEAAPQDGYTTFYSGLVRLWRLSEGTAETGSALSSPTVDGQEMIDRLATARVMLPDDARVPGFLGLSRVILGSVTGDTASVDAGEADLEDSIDMLPAYGHFLSATAHDYQPVGSAGFETSVADMESLARACDYEKDDSGAYVYPPGKLDYQHHVCNDEGIVAHVFEGVFITWGDIALKARWAPEKVRPLYESAKSSPTYAKWPFAAELEKRLSELDERAALYADDDVSNDPPMWATEGHICTGCHVKE
jgi:hypothetical protein